jgi:hypothetical protein
MHPPPLSARLVIVQHPSYSANFIIHPQHRPSLALSSSIVIFYSSSLSSSIAINIIRHPSSLSFIIHHHHHHPSWSSSPSSSAIFIHRHPHPSSVSSIIIIAHRHDHASSIISMVIIGHHHHPPVVRCLTWALTLPDELPADATVVTKEQSVLQMWPVDQFMSAVGKPESSCRA